MDAPKDCVPWNLTVYGAFVDLQGTSIIPRQFTNADHFWHGLARVAWNDGYGYIDKTGRTVWRVRR